MENKSEIDQYRADNQPLPKHFYQIYKSVKGETSPLMFKTFSSEKAEDMRTTLSMLSKRMLEDPSNVLAQTKETFIVQELNTTKLGHKTI